MGLWSSLTSAASKVKEKVTSATKSVIGHVAKTATQPVSLAKSATQYVASKTSSQPRQTTQLKSVEADRERTERDKEREKATETTQGRLQVEASERQREEAEKKSGYSAVTSAVIPTIGLGVGALAAGATVAAIASKIAAGSAVTSLAKVGTDGRITEEIAVRSGLSTTQFATNSATTLATQNWLSKLLLTSAKTVSSYNVATGDVTTSIVTTLSPLKITAIAGTIVATIGTYPFAGFIKEEALQTLGFGVSSAISNGDTAGAAAANQEVKDLLNPGLWDKIVGAIPYANVQKNLWDFYDAVNLQTTINDKIIEDTIYKVENNLTEADMYQKGRDEKKANDIAVTDYYSEVRLRDTDLVNEANIAANKVEVDYYNEQRLITEGKLDEQDAVERAKIRDEERAFWIEQAAFWEADREKQYIREAEDRLAIAEFWLAYEKEKQKMDDNNRPSNLNFGLI